MSRKAVTISLTAIATLMVIVSLFFAEQNINSTTSAPHTGYDAFVEHLHQTQFDKTGARNSVFSAPSIKHYAKDAHSLVLNPHIVMHNKKGIWNVTADTATTSPDNSKIYLKGHVVITQPATSTSPKTIIKTNYATVYPKRSYATTKAYVTINRATTMLAGQGATADMKQGVIKLLSHTRGHYVPAQQS
jgi:LPS export ABC transporter protein LptC